MKKLSEEQIKENYDKLMSFIEKVFSGDRKKKLIKLYTDIGERVATAPASSMEHFHGSWPGGYIIHVMKVIQCAKEMYELWSKLGAETNTFTMEELYFCALNHDLGKIGDMENDYYIPNPSEWHVKNQGRVYTDNPDIINMSIPDRGLWMIQNAGITLSQNEFLAIKLHDGPYEDANKSYFNAFQEHRRFKSNLTFILHYADFLAFRLEYEDEKKVRDLDKVIQKTAEKKQRKQISDANKPAMDMFNKMFEGLSKDKGE